MELVEGDTLRTILERGTPPLPHAIEWMAQLADGIAVAHHAGIIHRDLKPENVVVSTTGSAKILDFGLAKFRAGMGSRRDRAVVLSTPGIVLGTAGYMAPEQALGHEIDHRADLFAIGCILYECASGRYAFDGETAIDIMHRIIHGEPAPITNASPALRRVVARCLAKDPDQRYQSAKELAAALRTLHNDEAS